MDYKKFRFSLNGDIRLLKKPDMRSMDGLPDGGAEKAERFARDGQTPYAGPRLKKSRTGLFSIRQTKRTSIMWVEHEMHGS